MSYKKLEIWQLAKELVIDIHRMTIEVLPKFEAFEEGRQIRKSIKSVKTTIVEGYGRREYKQEFLRFLSYAVASNDETLDHLETLFETGSLANKDLYNKLVTFKSCGTGSSRHRTELFYDLDPAPMRAGFPGGF
jgi:four helix bundle protein